MEGTLRYDGDRVPREANREGNPENYIRFIGGAPTIEMRYRIGLLLGEPVWTFEAKYDLPRELQVIRNNRVVLQIRENRISNRITHSVQEGAAPFADQWLRINVPRDIYRLVRITGFEYSAAAPELVARAATGGGAIIDRSNPGITGPPGEWGWDVPGAPGWGRLFRHTDDVRGALQGGPWLDAASAKLMFVALARRSAPDNAWVSALRSFVDRGPLEPVEIRSVRVETRRLLAALRPEVPGLGAYLYGRAADRQAAALVGALERAAEREPDASLRDRAETVRRTLESMGSGVSPELVDAARDLERRHPRTEAERELRELGQAASGVIARTLGEEEEPAWPEGLAERLDALEARTAHMGLPDEDPLVLQVDALQSTLHGGLGPGQTIWIVATGSSRMSLGPTTGGGPYLTRRSSTPPTAAERERARRAEEQRRREREEALRRSREERARRNAELERGWVRSEVLRIRVPEDVTFRETSEGRELPLLEAWARDELGRHVIEPSEWNTYSTYRVRVFDDPERARERARELTDYRPVAVEPPSRERFR